jgi:hypothetical protein
MYTRMGNNSRLSKPEVSCFFMIFLRLKKIFFLMWYVFEYKSERFQMLTFRIASYTRPRTQSQMKMCSNH